MNYYSKQRNIIFKTLNNLYHPTAEELYNEVNRLYPTISKSTVYRNIGILLENNDIKKIRALNGPDRFDGNSKEHYHLICEKCGQVFDFTYHFDNEDLRNSIIEQTGIITDISNITLYGICNECKFQKKEDYKMELKGSKTEQNLMEAFAGESQARNKYTYFASKAKKDGYEQIAAIFEETANNEKEHAKMWFKLLNGGEVPSTVENLKAAAEGENFEWTDMYERMAKEAREEGFDKIAYLFEEVGKIEKEHEARFKKLLENVEGDLVFSKDGDRIWKCRNCGHIVIGSKAPKICPVCSHPQAYFEIKEENY